MSREIIPIKIRESKNEMISNKVELVDVSVDVIQERDVSKDKKGGRYRQLVNEKGTKSKGEDGNIGVAIAVAMLIFVIGVGVYEDRDKLFTTNSNVPTNVIQENNLPSEMNTETSELANDEVSVDVIPVDVISGSEESNE